MLLGAPLCFEPKQSRFRDAIVFLVPPTLSEAEPFPGSLLSQVSALASPSTFIWSRTTDAALSLVDYRAMEIHARVERWTLDEIAFSGRLVHQIVEWLFRENRLCRGALKIGDSRVAPSALSVPTLAIVNTADDIAPLASVKPFVDAMPANKARVIEYPGEVGVCLQHLGILVGREARTKVWPHIISWLNSQSGSGGDSRMAYRLFLCGDVMTGRGIDQVLPHPCDPALYEDYVESAMDYVQLAEAANGAIPRSVDPAYIWGVALDEFARMRPNARIINLETSITRSEDHAPKGINYRMSPANADCLRAAGIDCCVLANNHVLDWGRRGLLDTLETHGSAT